MIRKYRKRNRLLEVAYEKSSKSVLDKKSKLNNIMSENNQLRKSCDIYKRLIQDEQIKVEEARAQFEAKLRAEKGMLEQIEMELNLARKQKTDIQSRLHLAELSQARMLRRVRDAEHESSSLREFKNLIYKFFICTN